MLDKTNLWKSSQKVEFMWICGKWISMTVHIHYFIESHRCQLTTASLRLFLRFIFMRKPDIYKHLDSLLIAWSLCVASIFVIGIRSFKSLSGLLLVKMAYGNNRFNMLLCIIVWIGSLENVPLWEIGWLKHDCQFKYDNLRAQMFSYLASVHNWETVEFPKILVASAASALQMNYFCSTVDLWKGNWINPSPRSQCHLSKIIGEVLDPTCTVECEHCGKSFLAFCGKLENKTWIDWIWNSDMVLFGILSRLTSAALQY